MTDKEIFTKNFTGSIDELLDHCDKHAVYVNDVIEEKINVILSDEEAISLIKQECHGISDEDAKHVLNEIKIEYVTDMCPMMKMERFYIFLRRRVRKIWKMVKKIQKILDFF